MKPIRRFLLGALVGVLLLAQYGLVFADTTYVVQAGDTLYKIAQKFNVNAAALISANKLTNPNLIFVGQTLIIPSGGASLPVSTQPAATAGASGTIYVIQPGDTLYKIMVKFNVSASAIIAANRLANPSLLFVGQKLVIPGAAAPVPAATQPPAAQPAATAVPVPGGVYVVQAGDKLYLIAAKFNVDPAALIAANHITNPNLIYVGQRLVIPGATIATAVPPATAAPTATAVPATAVPVTVYAPTSTSTYNSRGIQGNSFSVENTSVSVNAEVWFDFQVTNTSATSVYYTALAAHTDVGYSAWSWTNQSLDPGQTLSWRDHMHFPYAGTYQLYLGICYGSDVNACKSQSWDRLSPSVSVYVH